jgi:hypothetical protein
MVDTTTRAEVPAGWLEALDRSQAQAEAGETVPLEPVLDRLRASIARMKAKRSEQDKQAASKM